MKKKSIILSLIFILITTDTYSAPWAPGAYVDGPAPATYERTPTSMKVYVDMPKYGGHTSYTLDSTAPNTKGGSYIAPKSIDVGGVVKPQIASNVKIPYGNAAGAAVLATLTMPILKSSIAKAAVALIRVQPAVATVMTFGWLSKAGYDYLSSSDTFNKSSPSVYSTSGDCVKATSSVQHYSSPDAVCQALNTNTHPVIYSTSSVSESYQCCNSSGGCSSSGASAYCYNSGSGGVPYTQQCQSPKTWDVYYKVCTDPSGSWVPATAQEAIDTLSTTPISGTVDTPETIDAELGELIKADYIPEPEPGVHAKLTGPNGETQINTPGEEETITEPDGSVALRRLEYQTRFADDRAEIEELLGITHTAPDGTQTTTTSSRPPNVTATTAQSQTSPPKSEPQKTDCDKYPDSVGCSKYGTVTAPETVPVTDVPISLNPTSLGSGSCPANKNIAFSFGSMEFEYQPYCDFMIKINPLMLAIAWLSAGFIVLSSVKE